MPLLSGVTGFFDKYILGYALGTAAGPSLQPFVQDLANVAWELNQVLPPQAYILAEGVAQGQVDPVQAAKWAHEQGFSDTAFQALVSIANTGPALGLAYQAWRRGDLSTAEFDTALQRTGLETQWFAALRALKDQPLDLGAIATAVHRGIMVDPTLIVREPPTTPGNVPQVPVSPLDPATEASWLGIDHERLRVQVGTTGLPPGLLEMLRLLNMGIVTTDDVQRAVAQSNLRNEYMDVVLNLRRQLLTAHEYVDGHVRAWITQQEMYAGTALHGMTQADTDLLFKVTGRPLSFHQVFIGERRGGVYNGPTNQIDPAFLKSLQESNIRPEWYDLAWAQRYNYPTAFVLRSLTEAGDLTHTEAENILLYEGWEPTLAAKVATKWAAAAGAGTGTGAAKVDPWVSKANNHLWTAVQKGYIGGTVDQANATQSLDLIGVSTTAQAEVFARWDETKRIEAL